MIARYRSSRSDEVYEAKFEVVNEHETHVACTCPSYKNRGNCGHVEQLRRWTEWGVTPPEGVLDPPPPIGSWQVSDA